jgi:hypothetical protein
MDGQYFAPNAAGNGNIPKPDSPEPSDGMGTAICTIHGCCNQLRNIQFCSADTRNATILGDTMKTWQKVALLGGGLTVTGAMLYWWATKSNRNSLSVMAGAGGTLQIKIGDTTEPIVGAYNHDYPMPTSVTLIATPNLGNQTNWNVNGIDIEQNVNQYTIYVNGLYAVSVTFAPKGGGGTTIAGIKPVGTVGTLQNFRFWYGTPFSGIDVRETDENWNDGQCQPMPMLFKVYDISGRGVANVQVNVFVDMNPDATEYRGTLLFNGEGHGPYNPLTLTTDVDGLVSFRIFNKYGGEPDITKDGFGRLLSQGTNLYLVKTSGIPPAMTDSRVIPIWKGWAAGLGAYISGNGGGGVISMGKIIRAEIADTDKATLQTITCDYGTKWKA